MGSGSSSEKEAASQRHPDGEPGGTTTAATTTGASSPASSVSVKQNKPHIAASASSPPVTKSSSKPLADDAGVKTPTPPMSANVNQRPIRKQMAAKRTQPAAPDSSSSSFASPPNALAPTASATANGAHGSRLQLLSSAVSLKGGRSTARGSAVMIPDIAVVAGSPLSTTAGSPRMLEAAESDDDVDGAHDARTQPNYWNRGQDPALSHSVTSGGAAASLGATGGGGRSHSALRLTGVYVTFAAVPADSDDDGTSSNEGERRAAGVGSCVQARRRVATARAALGLVASPDSALTRSPRGAPSSHHSSVPDDAAVVNSSSCQFGSGSPGAPGSSTPRTALRRVPSSSPEHHQRRIAYSPRRTATADRGGGGSGVALPPAASSCRISSQMAQSPNHARRRLLVAALALL